MTNYWQWSLLGAAILTAGIGATGAFSPTPTIAQTQNQNYFPDVNSDYWATPFIQTLAANGILAGYPDGTFKPEQAVDRDEFAAMIRQAFNQERVRTIPSGSVFDDVPANYWAAPPIEEAYETGFMRGFPGNLFLPRQEIPRVQALVSLTNGLNLNYNPSNRGQIARTPATTNQIQRPVAKNSLAFPLAATVLMQPVLKMAPVKVQVPPVTASTTTATPAQTPASGVGATSGTSQEANSTEVAALNLVQSYYTDAAQIPAYAVDDVAAATQAGMVVNYPELRVLRPNDFLNRGAAAALIYQALVLQGKIEPLAEDVGASRYVVTPETLNPAATQSESVTTP